MSARKAPRRAKAYEIQPTLEERAALALKLVSEGQERAVKAGYFCENDFDMPIAGTPPPLPYPWCGKTDGVTLVIKDETDRDGKPYIGAHCECTVCGAEAPGTSSWEEDDPLCRSKYGLALKAAQLWNTRGGA